MTEATFEQLAGELASERQRRERAEAAASEERARALRAQLNPHFLFNALTGLVATLDVRAAAQRDHVLRLSELLRETLRASEHAEHEVCEELALACAYLRIEERHRAAGLDWNVRVAPGCESALIPSLLLLPLVENATTHGSCNAGGRLNVEIVAGRHGRHLVVRLANTCVGERSSVGQRSSAGTGLGLRNVRDRLAAHFRGAAALSVQRSEGRFEVAVELPYLKRVA